MGSKEKRERALRDIRLYWSKLTYRLNWVFENLGKLEEMERRLGSVNIDSIKKGKIKEGEHTLSRIRGIVEEEKRLAKDTKNWLEQCRLLIVHQKKKIEEFEKNL